jgi:hypothetical protein
VSAVLATAAVGGVAGAGYPILAVGVTGGSFCQWMFVTFQSFDTSTRGDTSGRCAAMKHRQGSFADAVPEAAPATSQDSAILISTVRLT